MSVIKGKLNGGGGATSARSLVLLASALLVGATVGIAPVVASAGTATSATGYYTVAGVEYRNYAKIYTSSGSANADTRAGPVSKSVAAGWVGVRGRLFTSSGALSCEGANHYSTGSMSAGGIFVWDSCYRGGSRSWYSYGVSLAWNGSGYNSNYTFKSPNQNS